MDAREFNHIFERSSHYRQPLITRLDYNASGYVSYSGIAYKGSATSDSAWSIEAFYYNADGTLAYTLMSNFGVKWDDRATETYS